MGATAIINRVPGAGERYRPSCRAGAHRVRSVIDTDGGCFAVGHARHPRSTLRRLREAIAQVRRNTGSRLLVLGKKLVKQAQKMSETPQSIARIVIDLLRFDTQISLLFVMTMTVTMISMFGYIGVW